MYESYTRESFSTREYIEMVGSAIFVFNSNTAFLIENILKCDEFKKNDWYHMIDLDNKYNKQLC